MLDSNEEGRHLAPKRSVKTVIETSPHRDTIITPHRSQPVRWRRQRPFAAGMLGIVAGVAMLYGPIGLMRFAMIPGSTLWAALLVGTLVFLVGCFLIFEPALHRILGSTLIVLSLVSLVTQLGGLVVGMLCGIVGGALAIAWVPIPDTERRPSPNTGEFIFPAESISDSAETFPTKPESHERDNPWHAILAGISRHPGGSWEGPCPGRDDLRYRIAGHDETWRVAVLTPYDETILELGFHPGQIGGAADYLHERLAALQAPISSAGNESMPKADIHSGAAITQTWEGLLRANLDMDSNASQQVPGHPDLFCRLESKWGQNVITVWQAADNQVVANFAFHIGSVSAIAEALEAKIPLEPSRAQEG